LRGKKMAAENFRRSLELVLEHEGGWSDHPRDPGGATMKGITLRTFRGWRDSQRITREELRRITDDEVALIYEALYWNVLHCDELPSGIEHMVFDQGVNAGVRRSGMQLQTAARMTGNDLDGVVGPRTLARVNAVVNEVGSGLPLIEMLGQLHEAHYRGLRTFDTFGRGWLNRLEARRTHSRTLAGSVVTSS
jgi:lysozyme family protein